MKRFLLLGALLISATLFGCASTVKACDYYYPSYGYGAYYGYSYPSYSYYSYPSYGYSYGCYPSYGYGSYYRSYYGW